jgi:hypothetical protein
MPDRKTTLFPALTAVPFLLALVLLPLGRDARGQPAAPAPAAPVVEVEEDVYSYEDAKNGAGPMWCHGSTCLVRAGDLLYASGLDLVKGAKPLNNCRWKLYSRASNGWERVRYSPLNLTREPCPIAVTGDGRLFISTHPTLVPDAVAGPARPEFVIFQSQNIAAPRQTDTPEWVGTPGFTEHSYRSLAADAANNQILLLMHTTNQWAMSWCFREPNGIWAAHGEVQWPWGATYERPQPVRIAYPNVLLRNRAAYVCGVSDIVEPNAAWKAFKKELTGRDWDYDFRRLFYIRCPDVRSAQWLNWVEIASREATCGGIMPGDLWVDAEQQVHLVWSERALDERLRERFFPEARQSHAINYARLKDDVVLFRRTLVIAEEGVSKELPSAPRFQITPEGRMFVFFYVSGTDASGKAVSENRLLEVLKDGTPTAAVPVPLKRPMNSYFTATPRAGSPPSTTLDLLGTTTTAPLTISYARVQLR